MNLSPMDNLNIRKKQLSVLTNPSNYILDQNKEFDNLDNFISNTFYLDSNHQNNNNNEINQKKKIQSYIDSLVKNKLSEQNNEQISNIIINQENENQELLDNKDKDKYNSLLIENKELKKENKNLSNTIKNNE